MAKLLLLYLEGPMQSWGLRARWHTRDTGDEPSKSGVVGLFGCALGYGVGDERLAALSSQLRIGVRADRPGSVLRDYQTITGALPTAEGRIKSTSIESPRMYLQDASFLVAVEGPADAFVLDRLAQAVQDPHWPLYLGRKSCIPSRPVFESLTSVYATIEEALGTYPWQNRRDEEQVPDYLHCVVEDATGSQFRSDEMSMSPARMYDQRAVKEIWLKTPVIGEV